MIQVSDHSLVKCKYSLVKSGSLLDSKKRGYVCHVRKGNPIPKKLKGEFILDDDFATDDLSSTKEDRKDKYPLMVYLDSMDKAKLDRVIAIQSFLDGNNIKITSLVRKYIREDYEQQVQRLVDLGISTKEKEAGLLTSAIASDQL